MSHARVLSKIDDKEKIDEFVDLILNENLKKTITAELVWSGNLTINSTEKVITPNLSFIIVAA